MSATATAEQTHNTKRRHCWEWAQAIEDLHRVKSSDLKRTLQPKALELAERLCSHDNLGWKHVNYWDLRQKLGLSHKQIQGRLRRLRQAGLMDVAVHRYRYGVIDAMMWPTTVREGHGSQVYVKPRASFKRWGEEVVVYAPEHFEEWKMTRGTHGGKRAGSGRKRTKFTKSSCPVGETDESAKCLIFENPSKSSCPVITSHDRYDHNDRDLYPTGKGAGESARPPGGLSEEAPEAATDQSAADKGEADPLEALFVEFDKPQSPAAPSVRRGPLPESERGPRPKMPRLDDPERIAQGHPIIPAHAPPAARVQMVIDAYNAAASEVFGPGEPLLFGNSDPARSKLYPQLRKAADVLVEEEISPRAWATWCLQYAKKTGRARGLTRVFGAKFIAKRHGWFRKAHEDAGAGVRYEVKQWHMEQYLRSREAHLRWAYGSNTVPLSAPEWYHDMRRKERADGHADPFDMWVSKRGPGKCDW